MTGVTTESLALFKRLAAISRAVTTSLDFEEALGLIAGAGVDLVGASSCLVLLREGEEVLRICAAQGVDPAVAARFAGSMGESVLGELQGYLGFRDSEGIAASPIMSDFTVQGILVVIRDAPLNAQEVSLLSALADQAAIALGNAHVHSTLVSREAKLQEEVERSRTHARGLEGLMHSVAHDLRAPLRTMTGCGKLLSEGYGDPLLTGRIRGYQVRIASDTRRIDALVHDLLAYSHLAKAELHLEPVDLKAAVAEALAELQTEIHGQKGVVRVEFAPSKVLAHRRTLVRILWNLLSNALKFVSPGKLPLVEVGAEHFEEFVRVSVLDNGIGIGEAHLDHLFEGFQRLNRAEEYPGTGMGLAIVKRGMERMGGRHGVESELGKGSRFWIELRKA
jgi:signal transduction histidine kinase